MRRGLAVATVTKTFQFHAAHQLPNHAGKCRNLHGHTYRVDVSVTGFITEIDGSSNEGMVIDFDRLKDAWTPIDEALDHQYLNDLIDVPTAERIAVWIWTRLQGKIIDENDRLFALDITVWETPTSSAKVIG